MANNEYGEQMKVILENCDELVEQFESQMYETVMGHWNDKNRFLDNLSSKWWKGFIAYEAMYLITLEMAKKHIDSAAIENENGVGYEPKFFAIMNIHARACQIFLEILCLLKEGFTDGAFARWRSLFELSVYAAFISENNDKVALAYMEQANIDEKKAKWAKSAACFENYKGNIDFLTVFKKCNFSEETKVFWQKQYELASKLVHASPKGTMKRMGIPKILNPKPSNIMLVTGSDWGLHVLAEHAAISFYHTSAIFFSEPRNSGSIVEIAVLQKWVDVIRKHLYETVGTCFPEVEEAAEIYKEYMEQRITD